MSPVHVKPTTHRKTCKRDLGYVLMSLFDRGPEHDPRVCPPFKHKSELISAYVGISRFSPDQARQITGRFGFRGSCSGTEVTCPKRVAKGHCPYMLYVGAPSYFEIRLLLETHDFENRLLP